MGEWLIYGSNGVAKATVKKLEYNGEFMGETIVTCDVYSPSPISFSVGDYLSYRGENFVIDYDATRKKQSRVNTYGNGFVYEGMKFTSYVGELKKCDFLDFVLNDNLQHYSQLPTFDFYAETVEALADRLQANLNRMYTGSNAWTVSVVSGFDGKENVNVQISNIKCFDALKMAYEQFNAQYVIRGRHIYIGTAGSSLETTFRYGIGNGLKTIERSVDENDSLVTRLRAYGNTTNLPSNYYANKGRGCYAPIFEVYALYDSGADIHFKPKFANNWFTEKSDANGINYWVSVSLDKKLWVEGVASPNVTVSSVDFSVVSVMAGGNNTTDMYNAFKSQLQSATQNTKLYFSKGVNYTNWKSDWKETDEYMPNMMSIDRLMIPSFPEESTDPYIDSANISSLGIREKSVYFDGSEDELPDIHPSMEGMTAAELRAVGYTIDLDQGDNGNLDEIAADATELDGSAITTNGAFVEVNEVPGFKVTLKDIGFDINSYLSGDTATLSMKSGMCGGRDFTIVKVTKSGNKYVLECQRVGDANYYFPYNPYNIKAGDKFVLTNIEMPQAYIDAASQRLLVAAQEYLAKHSVPQWVYSIKMDDVWMQRQRDDSDSESESYYWNIKEGDIMSVQDSDLDINVSEVIDKLTIREGYSPIPEFEVVLRKEKPQGTIGVLQNRIKNLERQNQQQTNTIVRQQDYISLIIGDRLNTIQEQLDHVQVTYFGDYVPTLSNEPASTWQSSEYSEHDGDMFYNRTSGKGYEFTYKNGAWGWVEIQDEDIRQALEEAAAAQDTADGKRRVFVTPAGTLPTPPYDENDLWVNATYPSNSTSTDESQHKYYNDILKCITPRAEGATASINDWTLASKYTDDSSLNNFINGTYAQDLANVRTQTDAKAETWYQSSDPSSAWNTTALKDSHLGDIWLNTTPDANGNTHTYIYRKSGNTYGWQEVNGVPTAVFDMADGKASIYVSKPTKYKKNDLWIIESTIAASDIPTGCVKGDIVISSSDSNSYNKAHWTKKDRYTDDTYAHTFDYISAAIKGKTEVDGGLVLTNTLVLRDVANDGTQGNIMSGINGIIPKSGSTLDYTGIAAWYGGEMIDREKSAVDNAAKSLFRFDGSGYVASGNLSWDKNGNVTIQGYSINASTLQVGGANVATQAMLDNFVSKAFFNRLFTAYDANGNAIVPNDTTTAINNLKIMVGTWTEQFLSALGQNSSGGGSGAGLEDVWDSLTNQQGTVITDNTKIAIAHIPDTSSTYGYLKSSALNGYATQSWVNQQGFLTTHQTLYTLSIYGDTTKVLDFKPNANASIYIKAGGDISLTNDTTNKYITLSYTHPTNGANTTISAANGKVLSAITVNSLGHVTSVSSKTLAAADIPDISATYATASRATTLEGYFTDGVAKTAAKLNTGTTTYTAWGQTYWSSGVPQSISGNMTSVGSITPSANGNALGTTSARFNIYGTAGNFSGNVSITGTLGVTGATTLSSSLSVAGGITLTTTKKIYFGDTSHYLELDSTGFHFSHGVYSDSFMSALGANSSGGGSGTFDEEAMWTALGTTSTAKVIASSHIPNIDASKITSGTFAAARIPIATASAVGGVKVGTTLAISDGVLNQKSGIATAGTYRSITVDTYGRVTAGTNPTTLSGYGISDAYTKTQVDNALDGYLPLSGGTLTGGLEVGGVLYTKGFNHMIKFDVDTSRALAYGWWDTNSNTVASIVYHNTAQNIILNPIGSASVYSDAVGKYSLIVGNNKLTYNTYTILHSNNTYVSSGKGYINGTEITTISGNAATASLLSYSHGNEINFKGGMQASCYFNYRNADTGNEDGGTTAVNYKFCNYSGSTAYSTVTAGTFVGAFSGNATTATTLQTPRTIWGQSFDGSSNVSGSITGATTITASGRISASSFEGSFVNDGTVFYFGDSQHAIGSGTDAVLWAYGANSLLFYTNGSRRMTINSVGSVGIGTDSPSTRLHVSGSVLAAGYETYRSGSTFYGLYKGNSITGSLTASDGCLYYSSQKIWMYATEVRVNGAIYATGEITAASDARKKNIISNTKFNVKDIASARSILYEWNDGRDSGQVHGGSIAQDWLGKADSFLSQDNDGWYSINYGALALCSAITIAREVLKHDDEITRLKKVVVKQAEEIVSLKNKVSELEERRIA